MSIKARTGLVLVMGFLLGSLVSVTHGVLADRERTAELPYEQARMLAEVLERVRQGYVEPIDDRELMEHAIRGLLSGLDDHSAFLDPEEFRQMQEGTSGRYGGLGLEVTQEDGVVTVIAPIADTPASRAGLKAGDRILSVDGDSLEGLSLNEAVRLMRGEPGSRIVLGILPQGETETRDVELVRERIQTRSVRHELLEPGIGYVNITHFRDQVGRQTREAIGTMTTENGGHLNGLILDMRNNPGGILRGAVEVADLFLEEGLIVSAEGRTRSARFTREASRGDIMLGAPIVVLVNRGSASASEIVAGALQDHDRAVVMGATSFGKGSVQTIMPLPDNSAMKLTTSRYMTPSGRAIEGQGVHPDLTVRDGEATPREDARQGEKAMSAWMRGMEPDSTAHGDDAELGEALRVLRGLNRSQLAEGR
ncbi:S41 family peptidase [Natronospira bacteriovora]|uniref:S41 family peptidase n=1 Tax=Natronospira bacteriovora TaxID=3069753 RepID=UPI0035B56F13